MKCSNCICTSIDILDRQYEALLLMQVVSWWYIRGFSCCRYPTSLGISSAVAGGFAKCGGSLACLLTAVSVD